MGSKLVKRVTSKTTTTTVTDYYEEEEDLFNEPVFSHSISLAPWKLTLPIGKDSPLEIKNPLLNSYEHPELFIHKDSGLVFTTPCGGVTTKNSKYPRTELREMDSLTGEKASWNTWDMKHEMESELAILAIPKVKPHVSVLQIHDGDDDVLQVRLEDKKLFVVVNENKTVFTDDYYLGQTFVCTIKVENDEIKVYFNNKLVTKEKHRGSGNYFKAGMYTQSNPEKGDDPDTKSSVIFYDLVINHYV